MKKIFKNILFFASILIIELLIFKNNILVFASTKDISEIRKGQIFKNETTITYNDVFDMCNLVRDIEYYEDCQDYYFAEPIELVYYNSSNEIIKKDFFQGPYDYETDSFINSNLIINNEHSQHWKFEKVILDEPLGFKFVPYEYQKPEFNLTCIPYKTTKNNYTKCTLKTKYKTRIENIKFKIDSNENYIYDETSGELFENIEKSGGMYIVKSKNTYTDAQNTDEITIITFKVKNSDNIKITNLIYEDKLGNRTINEITIPKTEGEPDQNPNTGDLSFLITYAFVVLTISAALFLIIYKRENVQI